MLKYLLILFFSIYPKIIVVKRNINSMINIFREYCWILS